MELNMDRTEFVVQEDGSLVSECNDEPNASQRIRVRSDIQERRNTQSMTGTSKVPLNMFSVRYFFLSRIFYFSFSLNFYRSFMMKIFVAFWNRESYTSSPCC